MTDNGTDANRIAERAATLISNPDPDVRVAGMVLAISALPKDKLGIVIEALNCNAAANPPDNAKSSKNSK